MAGESGKTITLKGSVFLAGDEESKASFAENQLRLLVAVRDCGSISAAAKEIGISYKTAWDRIDAMNNMSDLPLIQRSVGGAKGGGAALTELGQKIIDGFGALQQEHEDFVRRLGVKLHYLSDIGQFMKGAVATSARNQFRGKVLSVLTGAVNAEIELRVNESQSLFAVITCDSVDRMGLSEGSDVTALVKASWVLLSKDTALLSSARNKLIGRVTRISAGAVNSDVTLDLGAGKTICAVVTNASVSELALNVGDEACALFKASSVILTREG